MEGAVPHRLYTLTHSLESFLFGFTRSTACRVLQIHGFGITSVLTRTPHDPCVIRNVITFWNPWTFWTCKTVGPFNLNRGQYSSLPSTESAYDSTVAAHSADLCDVASVDCPVWCPSITGHTPTDPLSVGGHSMSSIENIAPVSSVISSVSPLIALSSSRKIS